MDLKDIRGQRIVRVLAETGYYHLLFFALEEPTHCTHVKTLTLTASQRQQLADCLGIRVKIQMYLLPPTKPKTILKAESERLKPEILQKLEKTQKKRSSTVKSLIYKFFDKFFNLLSRD